MRLMDWFSQWFKKKEIVEITPLKIEQLEDWIKLQSHKLMFKSELNQSLPPYIEKLKEKRWLLECYLDKWEEKVSNEEIKAFFSETRQLLDKITFSEKINISEISQLNYHLEENIEILIENIEKSSFAHNFTFILSEKDKQSQHEITLNPLLKELIEINGMVKEIEQKITQSGFRIIESLVAKEKILKKSTIVIEEIGQQIRYKKEKLQQAEEKKNEKKKELSLLKNNPNYQKVNENHSKKKEMLTALKDKKRKIAELFFQFNPLLEQYERIYPKKMIVKNYLSDPYNTFLQDDSLLIIHILKNCKAALRDEMFTVPEDEDVVLENLDKSCKGYLSELQHQHFSLQRKLKELESSIEDKTFIAKLEEAQYRLDHFSKQFKDLQDNVSAMENKSDEIGESQLATKRLFENMVRMSLGKGVEIII